MKSRRLNLLIAAAIAAVVTFTAFAVAQNPVPLISQPLVPDAVKPGGTAFTLTVDGSGFVSGSVVHWNGSPRTTTFVSQTQLKASILASDIATARTASVTVVNPVPGGGMSNAALLPVTKPSSSIALSAPQEFDVGSSPASVAVGDFNGDGTPDLAVVEGSSNTVSILLGNGDGTFQPPVEYPTGAGPSGIAIGDFNRDGKLDLAISNQYPGSVSILLGRGDGTFEPGMEFTSVPEPYSLAVGDFNGDGNLDLVVADSGPPLPGGISILLGNGDGTFQPAVYYNGGIGTGPSFVAVGDFNNDGKLDLAVANFACYVGGGVCLGVLLGKGDGSFQPAVNYTVGAQPLSIAVGDFNHDGKLDLAVANNSTSNVSVLLGNGDGTFKTAVNYATPSDAVSVAVGDFNGDGNPDLVVANQYSTEVSIFLGNGDGTFQAALDYNVGSNPSWVAVGDFNGDGRLDVAVADSGSTTASIVLQSPTVSISATSVTFADQVIGTRSAAKTVTLSNTSNVLALSIASIAVTGMNAADFGQTHTCGASLAPGANCTISMTFSPTHVGPRTASVIITDNAVGTPHEITLSGTGVLSGANATLSVPTLTFATQPVYTTSPAQSVTLTNYGTAALSITGIATTGDFNQADACGSSLAVLASCLLNVTFTPTLAGARTGTLSVKDNALGSPQTLSLSGTGTLVTEVQLSPNSLNFGSHPLHTIHRLSTTLTNISSKPLSITSITITGSTDDFSQANNCGNSVGPQGSCTITVTFIPTALDTDGATLSITDNGTGSPQIVTLSGGVCVPFPHRICN